MSVDEKRALCSGCRNDYYNRAAPKGCWSLESAEIVNRWRLGWWTDPTKPGAFVEVETLSCHHAPGQYAHSESLPAHAVDPVDAPLLVQLRARSR